MRKTMKFLHTMAAIGFTGAIAALLVLHASLPDPSELERFATLRVAMGAVAEWMLLPSMGLVLVSGLLSFAVTPAFQNAGWVWAKLASGVIVFESTLVYVQAPMQRAAERAVAALNGETPAAELGATLQPEWFSFWIIGAVAVANVVLGVWRPRFGRTYKRWTGAGSGSVKGAAAAGAPVEGTAASVPTPGEDATSGKDGTPKGNGAPGAAAERSTRGAAVGGG